MSKRNLIWLAAIVVVGVVATLAGGWIWGLIGAGAILLASEVAERVRRHRRRAQTGERSPSPRDAITSRRRTR